MSIYIDPNSTKYDIETFKAALKKRYKDEFDPSDVQGAFADAKEKNQTLGEAVKELVDLYVQTDGHDRNLILTQAEIDQRKVRDNKLGVFRAIAGVLHANEPATAERLITATRMQVTMRKLTIVPRDYSSGIMSALHEANLIQFNPADHRRNIAESWSPIKQPRAKLSLIQKLTDDEILQLCPDFSLYVPREEFRRPFTKPRQQHEYSTED